MENVRFCLTRLILLWNSPKLQKLSLGSIVMHITKVSDAQSNAMFTFMKAFMDT